MSQLFQKIKIVKLFASSDYKTRNKAYKVIINLLKLEFGDEKKQLSNTDILGIWRGLYVWLWMQDKPILHEEVVGKICSLLSSIKHDEVALEFINAFFVTMDREWSKIDKHRLDKYYMLVRDFFQAQLKWLEEKQWVFLERYISMLNSTMNKLSNSVESMGFQMHLTDIFLDELIKTNPTESVTTSLVTQFVLSIGLLHHSKLIIDKMNQRVLSKLISLYSQNTLKINIKQVGTELFNFAGKKEVVVYNRKVFHYFSKKFSTQPENSKLSNSTSDAMENDEMDVTENNDQSLIDESDKPIAANGEIVTDKNANIIKEKKTDTEVSIVEKDETEMEVEEENSGLIDSNNVKKDELAKSNAKKSKKTKKMKKENKLEKLQKSPTKKVKEPKTEVTRNGGDKDKRVTFGKLYRIKFKRGTTSVGLSQGTVRQEEIKSILKKK